MSFFLVFLAVLLIGGVLWASAGIRGGKQGGRPLPRLLEAGFEEPPANLPPVLLPANAAPQDVDRVRFALGLRGYRMDQVDQVLDDLRDQLAASRQEVEALKGKLHALEQAACRDEAPTGVPQAPGPGTPPDTAGLPATAGPPATAAPPASQEPAAVEPAAGEDRD